MGLDEDIKKQARFNELEKIILSSEFKDLSLNTLKKYKNELPANIPDLDRNTYNPKCEHLMSLLSSEIDGIISKRRFRIQIALSLLILAVASAGLILKCRDLLNTNEPQIQTSKPLAK